MTHRRVVVTGLGIVSPVGRTVASAWEAIREGRSGIGPITRFDTTDFPCKIGGDVADFDLSKYLAAKEARKTDPFVQYGIAAGCQAVKDSGIEINETNTARVGVAMGAGIGGLTTIENNYRRYLESRSPRKISPFFVPSSIINMISGYLSIMHGLRGPNLALVTACTTGTHSIGVAARAIAYGDAELMLAGGAEMATTELAIGGFCMAKALSTRNEDPEGASRPWDSDRDGFVLSDGAAALMLEEREHARARGANIYAELIGFGMSGDAHHITAPLEDGSGARLSERFPWIVAFSFGLLHGFGFAGALQEIGLPKSDVPLALLAFNLGVEAGQLLFITAAVVAGAMLSRFIPIAIQSVRTSRSAGSICIAYLIGGVSAYWLIERVASF